MNMVAIDLPPVVLDPGSDIQPFIPVGILPRQYL
jgi:hypothetical protein